MSKPDDSPAIGGKGQDDSPELSGARAVRAIRRMGIVAGLQRPYYVLRNQQRWQLEKHLSGVAQRTWRVRWDLIEAIRTFAAALHDPSDAYGIFRQRPVTFSRWQRLKIRWYIWRGKLAKAQRVILGEFGNTED